MRIAFLTNNAMPPGEGIGWHIVESAKRLSNRGHQITILARGNHANRWQTQILDGLLIRHYPYLGLRPFQHERSRRAIQQWLNEGAGGNELLHVHLPLMPALKTGLPIVATFHSPMLTDTAAITEPGLRARFIKSNAQLFSQRKESWYLRHAKHVIAVSKGVRNELHQHYSAARRRIDVIPNAVDHSFFIEDPLAERTPTILYVGRLGYRKGLLRLLDAFAELHERPLFRHMSLKLELIGEGPLRPIISKRAKQLGLGDKLVLHGAQDRMAIRAALRTALCYVNPADYESGPLTMLEALAAQTPVVTTNTGLAAEFGPEMPVWRCDPDASSMARQFEMVLGQPERAAQMARQCRGQIEQVYDWDRVADALLDIYLPAMELAA